MKTGIYKLFIHHIEGPRIKQKTFGYKRGEVK